MRALLPPAALLALALPLAAQGGGYVSPDEIDGLADLVPPAPVQPGQPAPEGVPGQPTPPSGPTVTLGAPQRTPGALNTDVLDDWGYWWYVNREALLDLEGRWPAAPAVIRAAITDEARPVLEALLGATEQDDVRASAAIALARLDLPASAPSEARTDLFITLARSGDPQLAETAMLALGLVGDFRALEVLAAILGRTPAARTLLGSAPGNRQRAFAAYALGVMATHADHDGERLMIAEHLWGAVAERKTQLDVRVAAINAIGLCQLPWERDPTRKTDPKADPAPTDRVTLVARLWEFARHDRSDVVRAHLAVAIAKLLDDAPEDVRGQYVARFAERLEASRDARERGGLAIGLGRLGSAWGAEVDLAARRTLRATATGDASAEVRHLALMALVRATTDTGQAPPPAPVRAELEAFLQGQLASGTPADRGWVALAAATLGAELARHDLTIGDDLFDALVARLAAEDANAALCAVVLALGFSREAQAGPLLQDLLGRARNAQLRGFTALALGLVGRQDAAAALEAQLREPHFDASSLEHTAFGLALLDRKRARDALLAHVAKPNTGREIAPLAAALGRIGDGGTLESLATVARARSTSVRARSNLAVAIGLIADPRPVSWRAPLAEDSHYQAWTPTLVDQGGYGVLNIF